MSVSKEDYACSVILNKKNIIRNPHNLVGYALDQIVLKLYHYSNDVKRFVLLLGYLCNISSIKSYTTYAILLIGFSKPGGCLCIDRVLRTRSQTQ